MRVVYEVVHSLQLYGKLGFEPSDVEFLTRITDCLVCETTKWALVVPTLSQWCAGFLLRASQGHRAVPRRVR